MYRAHRPRSMQSLVQYDRSSGAEISRTANAISLANGTEVMWPSDLIPLVGADTPFAERAREADRITRTGTIVGLSGLGVSFGGAGLLFGGIASGDGLRDEEFRPMVIAGGLLALAGLAMGFGGMFYAGTANAARLDAYMQADAAMRARLRICGEEPQLVDCDTGAAVAPMPGYAPVYAPSNAPTIPWQHAPAARRPDE